MIFRPQKIWESATEYSPFSVLIPPTLCESSHPRKNADKLLVILGEFVPKVPKTPGVPQGSPSLRRPPVCNKAATPPRHLPRMQSFCVLSQSERSPAQRYREARIDNFVLGLHFMSWWRVSELCWHDINCAERSSLCCCFLLCFFSLFFFFTIKVCCASLATAKQLRIVSTDSNLQRYVYDLKFFLRCKCFFSVSTFDVLMESKGSMLTGHSCAVRSNLNCSFLSLFCSFFFRSSSSSFIQKKICCACLATATQLRVVSTDINLQRYNVCLWLRFLAALAVLFCVSTAFVSAVANNSFVLWYLLQSVLRLQTTERIF